MSKERVKIPTHVAIIMDGNGRWAEKQGKERIYGHMNGVGSVRSSVKAAIRNEVRYLTLYAFSTENWGRPAQEVDALMELFCKHVIDETAELARQGVHVKAIGDMTRLSPKVQEHLARVERDTAGADKLTVILALNYSSYQELTRAAQLIAGEVAAGTLAVEDITQGVIQDHLYTAAWPNPDLMIRTGGEQRISNFLLWQLSYAELYFTDVYWPDFDEEEFDKALADFANRDRRFGLVKKNK